MAVVFNPNNVSIVRSPRVEPFKWVYTNFFADYWCMICLDWYEQACQTGTFEQFWLSLKIQNGRHQNRRIYWVWGRNVGVRAENWPGYPQMVIYRSPKISHESYVALGKKTAKIQDCRQKIFWKNSFLTSNPIIECDMSFLTIFGAWNQLVDLKLQLFHFYNKKIACLLL